MTMFLDWRLVPLGCSCNILRFSAGVQSSQLINVCAKLMTESRFIAMFWVLVSLYWVESLILRNVFCKQFL